MHMDRILLTILIPTLPNRRPLFNELLNKLLVQSEGQPVEILSLLDNRVIPLGKKRQMLLDMAQGEYIVFIDDDDKISDDYIQTIILAIYQNPGVDVITHPIHVQRTGGGPWGMAYYGLKYTYATRIDTGTEYYGPPPHTVPWRREIAQQAKFPPGKIFGEDSDWVTQACKLAKTEIDLGVPLYWYCFDERVSETRRPS